MVHFSTLFVETSLKHGSFRHFSTEKTWKTVIFVISGKTPKTVIFVISGKSPKVVFWLGDCIWKKPGERWPNAVAAGVQLAVVVVGGGWVPGVWGTWWTCGPWCPPVVWVRALSCTVSPLFPHCGTTVSPTVAPLDPLDPLDPLATPKTRKISENQRKSVVSSSSGLSGVSGGKLLGVFWHFLTIFSDFQWFLEKMVTFATLRFVGDIFVKKCHFRHFRWFSVILHFCQTPIQS